MAYEKIKIITTWQSLHKDTVTLTRLGYSTLDPKPQENYVGNVLSYNSNFANVSTHCLLNFWQYRPTNNREDPNCTQIN